MLCEKCNKNEATIHLITLVNGQKTEKWLCDKCAKDISENPMVSVLGNIEGTSLKNILGGFFEALDKKSEQKMEVVCKKCGLTYSQFKKSGQLGCCECYESFADSLKPMIKRIQGDVEHIGKIPTKSGNKFIEMKRVNKLKRELQDSIMAEEYEKAAVLRDKIKLLESSMEVSKNNEKLDS